MKKVKRLAAVVISVILLTLNASTMTYGFQNDGKISRDATPANPEKQTILYYSWEYVTMYYPNGSTISVYRSEVENYKKLGLTDDKYEFYTTMYSSRDIASAKKEDVYNDYVDDYKKRGWIPKADLITTLYSDDGRSVDVPNDKVAEYKAVGWKDKSDVYVTLYTEEGGKLDCLKRDIAWKKSVGWHEWDEIFQTLYSMDGKTIDVNKKDITKYKKEGWYELNELYVPMYSEDGRMITVWKDNVKDYEKVGWYTMRSVAYSTVYPLRTSNVQKEIPAAITNEYIQNGYDLFKEDYMTVLYSLDDRKIAVKNTEVQNYKKVGWYTYKDYLNIKVDEAVKKYDYETALCTLLTAKSTYWQNEDRQAIIGQKMQDLRYAWMKAINSPVAVIWGGVEDSYGYPVASIGLRNICDKDITSFEVIFTCYDAYGKVTTDYPWLYNGTVTASYDRGTFKQLTKVPFRWTLYSNERTVSIKNVRVVKVAYSDGTTWHS